MGFLESGAGEVGRLPVGLFGGGEVGRLPGAVVGFFGAGEVGRLPVGLFGAGEVGRLPGAVVGFFGAGEVGRLSVGFFGAGEVGRLPVGLFGGGEVGRLPGAVVGFFGAGEVGRLPGAVAGFFGAGEVGRLPVGFFGAGACFLGGGDLARFPPGGIVSGEDGCLVFCGEVVAGERDLSSFVVGEATLGVCSFLPGPFSFFMNFARSGIGEFELLSSPTFRRGLSGGCNIVAGCSSVGDPGRSPDVAAGVNKARFLNDSIKQFLITYSVLCIP